MPDGPGGFAQNSSCSALLRIPLSLFLLRLRGSHPLWPNFPGRSSHNQSATAWSYYPAYALPHMRFGLFPGRSPLLGESLLFSSPAGTKMFQFPAFASAENRQRMSAIKLTGCPIRKSAHHRICAPTRGLSQLITSFVAFVSLGIRHAPLVTF